jgi:hypothetical protein
LQPVSLGAVRRRAADALATNPPSGGRIAATVKSKILWQFDADDAIVAEQRCQEAERVEIACCAAAVRPTERQSRQIKSLYIRCLVVLCSRG